MTGLHGNVAGALAADAPVPAALDFVREPKPVWRNELGGLTFAGRLGTEAVFAKWAPPNGGPGRNLGLAAERDRLLWAEQFTLVPHVLDYRTDGRGEVLVTRAIRGQSAVSERWLAEPSTAVRALATGLRALHDMLPVAECPFDWSVEMRLAGHPELDDLKKPPPTDILVVAHGDPCAPNTLLGDDGGWTAHVDLGRLGIADRWADIAVASRNTVMNYGPGWENAYLDAYGIDGDPVRMAYYCALWDRT